MPTKRIQVRALRDTEAGLYNTFLLDNPFTLMFQSWQYKCLLEETLDTRGIYLIACCDKIIQGALPLFIKDGPYGKIINSLPFYSGNGGIILRPDLDQEMKTKIANMLLDELERIENEEHAIATTLVDNPLENTIGKYAASRFHLLDERTGQILYFQHNATLMEGYHVKTRNSLRKAQKLGLQCYVSETPSKDIAWLYKTHKENIESLGGIPKPRRFFSSLKYTMDYHRDYKIYVAKDENTILAMLLLFYFNRCVEYYTPAIRDEYRSFQPMSLLVDKALSDAKEEGFSFFNFGGTWKSQEGVYRFKKRWGAIDMPYKYYIKQKQDVSFFKSIGMYQITQAYPFYYCLPFNLIER
jgi:hypothetical protein